MVKRVSVRKSEEYQMKNEFYRNQMIRIIIDNKRMIVFISNKTKFQNT